jgi:hypothetical protein
VKYITPVHITVNYYLPWKKIQIIFQEKKAGGWGIDEEGCGEVISTSSIPTARKKSLSSVSRPLAGDRPI